MTDRITRSYRNHEAARVFVAFFMMAIIVSVCLDIGYLQAKKFNLQGSVNLAGMTAVEALPDLQRARALAKNVANSQGVPLENRDIVFDYDRRWIEISKTDYYETMFLKHVGIKRIPIKVHVFDFKPELMQVRS